MQNINININIIIYLFYVLYIIIILASFIGLKVERMNQQTSWTIDERLDSGVTHDEHVSEENLYENDPETESALRYEVSKLITLLALNAMRRSHWEEYNNRVELLLLLFRFMRLKRKDAKDVQIMVQFIIHTNFGGAEEMAELKDLGYSFQDNHVLEIAYAKGNRTPEGFLDTLEKFYNMDVFNLFTKNSIKILSAYVKHISNNDAKKIGEMRVCIMGMVLTNNNPSFLRFGILLRNLYVFTSNEEKSLDLSSIKDDLKQFATAKENYKIFLDCEDSVFEMFKEINRGINANCQIDENSLNEIKIIIHKNTTLNSKNGKVINRYEKDSYNNTTRKGKNNKRSLINDDDDDDENDLNNTLKKMLPNSDNSDNSDNVTPKPKKCERKRTKLNSDDDDDDDDDDNDGASDDDDFNPSDEEDEDEEGEEDESGEETE